MSMRKVLIVEDDEAMAVALRDGFTYEGYEVSRTNGSDAGPADAEEVFIGVVADIYCLDGCDAKPPDGNLKGLGGYCYVLYLEDMPSESDFLLCPEPFHQRDALLITARSILGRHSHRTVMMRSSDADPEDQPAIGQTI